MSDVDKKATEPAPTGASTDPAMGFAADQAMDFEAIRPRDVTFLLFKGDPRPYIPSFGTRSEHFFAGLIRQVANAVAPIGRFPDEDSIKFMLAFIRESKPRDEIEAMLISHMNTSHDAVMRFANRLACAETDQERDSAERIYTKMARTFTAQVDALKRYRATSQATVIVQQNVLVGDGHQDAVGTEPPHEMAFKNEEPATPVLAAPRSCPMEIIGEAYQEPVAPRRRQKK
jgi:hypothetical protein